MTVCLVCMYVNSRMYVNNGRVLVGMYDNGRMSVNNGHVLVGMHVSWSAC